MFRFNFQDDLDKITYFSDFLEGEAAQWYFALTRSGIRNSTFNEFLVRFQRKYYNSNAIDDVMDRMFNCCQTSSLITYNQEFGELASALPTDLFNERTRLNKYVNGLKPELKRMVRTFQPETLEDAMNIATNMAETPNSFKQTTRTSTLPYGASSYEPMEVDSIQTEPIEVDAIYKDLKNPRRQKLSSQERQLLMKLGICFRCRAGQHRANQCPNASSP